MPEDIVKTAAVGGVVETKVFGMSTGGAFFETRPIQSIAMRAGVRVDAINLNGEWIGGNGGAESSVLTFEPDEYITDVIARTGGAFDFLQVVTNKIDPDTGKPRTISGGGSGGTSYSISNARVLEIGANAGNLIDKLRVMYVKNYQPSASIQKKAKFVLSYTAPGTELETYNSSESRTMESFERMSRYLETYDITASAKGEFMGKLSGSVSTSTTMHFENANMETIAKELENKLSSSEKKLVKVPSDSVGVHLATCDVMQDVNGTYWYYPSSDVSFALIKLQNYQAFLEHYDMTGTLSTQIPSLKQYETKKYDAVYYRSSGQ